MRPSITLAILALSVPGAAAEGLGADVAPASQTVELTVDPARDEYTGTTVVELDVKRPAASFRFHAKGPRIGALRLARDGQALAATFAAAVHDTVEVTPARPLAPGRHRLTVEFTAPFNRQAVGLYKVVHRGEPYLFSQLQAIEARRAFPCWDEPRFKIPWQLTVTVPQGLEAVSNTPVEDQQGGRVRFARTRPLPSYLLALAVGRFDSTPIPGMSIPGRVLAPRGEGSAPYAAKITPPLLAALERYFGSKYPYEKLDLIAVPEYWYGAMENPGAIVFRDTILLRDEASATPDERRGLVTTMAHELAHMWFGDLVTMAAWDDFWLNESFAAWLGDKVSAEVYPELDVGVHEALAADRAMLRDARPATRAIRLPGIAAEEAMRTVFNVYDKGQSVLAMFERYLGEERFRDGIRDHMAAHAWKNAATADFFASLGRHARGDIAGALESFVAQPGVPLVAFERVGPAALRVTQSRFVATGEAPPLRWTIPLTLRAGGARTIGVLLAEPERTVEVGDAPWIFPHADGAGYHRWQVPDPELRALARRAELSTRERIAMLGNAGSLFSAGRVGAAVFLDVLETLAADPDPHVAAQVAEKLAWLEHTFATPATRITVASYVRRLLHPVLARIGWQPQPGERDAQTELRPVVLLTLAIQGRDEGVRQRARAAARRWLKDPASLHPSLVDAVLAISAIDGRRSLFEEYRRRFEAAKTPRDRERFLGALTQFARRDVRARALAYVLEGPLRPTELFAIPLVALDDAETARTFAWFARNHDQLAARIPPAFMAFAPELAASCDPALIDRARAFFGTHELEGTAAALARAAETTAQCAALRERELAAVTAHMRAAR
jgi:alanyl aminopeptidase